MQKTHDLLAKTLASKDTSPAAMAYKMLRESRYVNESMLQYLTNYISVMAKSKVVPEHLEEVREVCVALNGTLEELGLTGSTFKHTR